MNVYILAESITLIEDLNFLHVKASSIAQTSSTMPRAKQVASISALVDTDIEDDTMTMEADAFPTPDSNQENAPAKKKGKQAKASTKRFTKPKTRRSGDGIVATKVAPKTKAGTKRAPLKEQRNNQQAEETEEVDEFEAQGDDDTAMDELVEPKPPAKRKANGKRPGRPPKKATVQQVNATQKDGEFEFTPTAVRQAKGTDKVSAALAKKPNVSKRQQSVEPRPQEKVIPETQIPMDTDPSGILEEAEDDEDAVPQSVFRRTKNARNEFHQRQPNFQRRQGGSASDTERAGSDPTLRRRLGDITKKFETLELKYNNLKEVGSNEAKARFQDLEVSSQARAKGKGVFSNLE